MILEERVGASAFEEVERFRVCHAVRERREEVDVIRLHLHLMQSDAVSCRGLAERSLAEAALLELPEHLVTVFRRENDVPVVDAHFVGIMF